MGGTNLGGRGVSGAPPPPNPRIYSVPPEKYEIFLNKSAGYFSPPFVILIRFLYLLVEQQKIVPETTQVLDIFLREALTPSLEQGKTQHTP